MTSRRTFLAALLAALGTRSAGAQTGDTGVLVAAMQRGGLVVFMRHAATVATQVDTGRLGDRAGQRNLSDEGRQQARDLGDAFRALRIPLDEILASPVFRSRDTAELAFGADRIRVTTDLVADDYTDNVGAMVAATRRLLITAPPAGRNRLLIGHRIPLQMVTGRSYSDAELPEGGMALFTPGGAQPRLFGTLSAAALIGYARRASTLQTPPPRAAI